MIYTINGEQPFQVLSESFSVSPSQSGYDLYLSADGHNYSKFATVAANTTRQFTGMNEGNYYLLSGNTSTVKVNWMKDCGGGGGAAAGVSSIDGQTGALTTKTINGNSILGSGDIVISGGSSEQNYLIVDALSAVTSPVDGMYVYVNSGVTQLGPYSAISFDASDCNGGSFYFYDSNNERHYFGISADDVPMVDTGSWATPEGDGIWRLYTGWRGAIYIKYDSQTDIYSIAIPYEGAYNLTVSLNDSVPYTISTENIPFENKGYFARRIGGNWIRTEYHFDELSANDAAQAYSEIVSLSGQGYTEIYFPNGDGGISKAGWWYIDWNDSQKIRVIGTPQGNKWYTCSINSDGSVVEKNSIIAKEQVYNVEFSFTPSTSAWTSNINDLAYQIYQSWSDGKLLYAKVYDNDNSTKLGTGNVMHFWRNTNDDLYYNFCFGFNFVDINGVEWKTKWTYDDQSDPKYVLTSMTQVS